MTEKYCMDVGAFVEKLILNNLRENPRRMHERPLFVSSDNVRLSSTADALFFVDYPA